MKQGQMPAFYVKDVKGKNLPVAVIQAIIIQAIH
jgi:hypothetical protein